MLRANWSQGIRWFPCFVQQVHTALWCVLFLDFIFSNRILFIKTMFLPFPKMITPSTIKNDNADDDWWWRQNSSFFSANFKIWQVCLCDRFVDIIYKLTHTLTHLISQKCVINKSWDKNVFNRILVSLWLIDEQYEVRQE